MRTALDKDRLRGIYDRVSRRYDLQHGWLTGGADQRGRRMVVDRTVSRGDRVLDCGAGTGSTALLAARRAGPSGAVTLFDLSEGMLEVASRRALQAGLEGQLALRSGDMTALPFEDGTFDVVLSTYSMCPLYDPVRGALELYRVAKAGGRLGIAHSTDPERRWVRWLADRVEGVVWRFPSISLGCRSVSVLPTLLEAGGRLTFEKRIGVPLWPFVVFVVEKPRA